MGSQITPTRAAEARVYTATSMADSAGELHEIGWGLAAVYTAAVPEGDPTANEDSCALVPYDERSGVLVVADGCGGLPSGEEASRLAIAAVRQAVRAAARKQSDLRMAVLDGIERANRDVIAMGVGAGTTLAVAEVSGERVRPYHVGDSQIMVIGQRGKVKLTTMSHSPVGYAVEAGLIKENDALHHEQRHVVSNIVGSPMMHIQVGPTIDLSPMDTVLVASDGLYDNLRPEEIVEICRKGQLLAISGALVDEARRRMTAPKGGEPSKPDDLTFIAYRRRAVLG